jgi:wyosine [tRNA(Phe)-imidazoG37] synthetase (radical SAM superfamily)
MTSRPFLVYADAEGRIFEWPELEMLGASGGKYKRLDPGDWIPLPPGSELFLLPHRQPMGYNPRKRHSEVLVDDPYSSGKPIQAVAAFVAPAHTQIYSAAYRTLPKAPLLPLFAYTAVGWKDGHFVVAALRVDPDERQDFRHFDRDEIRQRARARIKKEQHNRLVHHLGRCAISYGCPAARNLFMARWEAPLPTSPACNAGCLGCISLQQGTEICATQERINFVPTAEEISAIAVPHLKQASKSVVSFGQGCEGEPLLQAEVIGEAIRAMRQATTRGTINLNTNGSLPEAVKKLCAAGLDSIRVSLNSCRPDYYRAYFRPQGYRFEALVQSLQIMKAHGGFASINYFILPGFTDQEEEWKALCCFLTETRVDLIQMRNLNIDPEWYLKSLGVFKTEEAMGILEWMRRVKDRFPDLGFGYFNPCLDTSC